MTTEELMRLAIAAARRAIENGQGPVGCVIARDGVVLASEYNRARESLDVSAHAEIVALRAAAQAAGSRRLPGAIAVTTCEPCPMCAAALHFAEVSAVVYGASIADLEEAGYRQIQLSAAELFRLAGDSIRVEGGVLGEECRRLLYEDAKRS